MNHERVTTAGDGEKLNGSSLKAPSSVDVSLLDELGRNSSGKEHTGAVQAVMVRRNSFNYCNQLDDFITCHVCYGVFWSISIVQWVQVLQFMQKSGFNSQHGCRKRTGPRNILSRV